MACETTSIIILLLQVAALAPLALLLLLEARCDHLVVAHLNYVVEYCMSDCSHLVIAMGTVVPMSKVEGSLI